MQDKYPVAAEYLHTLLQYTHRNAHSWAPLGCQPLSGGQDAYLAAINFSKR